MVVTENDLNAQVSVALGFLESMKTQNQEVSKARFCILALKEKLEEFYKVVQQHEELTIQLSKKNENNFIKICSLEKDKDDLEEIKSKLSDEVLKLQQNLETTLNKLSASRSEVDRLKQGIASMRSEINGLNKSHAAALDDAKKSAKEKSKKAIDKEKAKVQALASEVATLRKEKKQLEGEIESIHGKKAASVAGMSEGVRFFIHEYNVPINLVLRDNVNRIRTIGGLPWHFQVMRNNCVSVVAMVSEWLTPVFPMCKDFNEEWNENNTLVVHAMMMEKAKETKTATKEYLLTMAAKQATITNDGRLSEQERDWLKKAKMITLFDAVGVVYPIFAYDIEKANSGVTAEQISELHDKIKTIADDFISIQMKKIRDVVSSVNSGTAKSV
ncbi:TPA: hypothetical protein ACPVZG_000621 [Vibrio parahaemolyticus]